MKRYVMILLALLSFAAGAGAAHEDSRKDIHKDTLKVLAIGNSFSQDAVEQNLHEIAKADGQEMVIGNMYIGGCSLERHCGNIASASRDYEYRKVSTDGIRVNTPGVTLEEALSDEDWDIVTLQQYSPDSGFWDSYEPYLGQMVDFVRSHTRDDARLCFHQTWAYAEGSMHPSFPLYGCDQKLMYRKIVDASSKACARYSLPVIPCGTAVQNLRASCENDNCTRDGYHLNNTIGRYTAALTWYETLTGRSVIGNAYHPAALSDFRTRLAQHAAHAAVAQPYAVSNFGFRKKKAQYGIDVAYTLPDPFTCQDGSKVRNKSDWMEKRRPELLSLFETEMFGKAPAAPAGMSFKLLSEDKEALCGLATRREVVVQFDDKRSMTLLMYVPNAVKKAPVFLGINFYGNETISFDPDVTAPEYPTLKAYGVRNYSGRGKNCRRWPLETILLRGYAVVTFCRDDIDPDFEDGYANGVHPLGYAEGQTFPAADEWGSIAAWSWGLSRALDYLETDELVDASRVAVFGHSRLGKTALWAGAADPRFALVISNCSGCGGAAISRRRIGETVEIINSSFPHWFCDNFKRYNGKEDSLPFDQHELLALIAPRPLYVASADQDLWADPEGEQLAAREASKVWTLFGRHEADKVGSHVRKGKHDILLEDWMHYLDFADRWM